MRRMNRGAQILEKAHDLVSNSRDLARDGAARARSFVHDSPVLSAAIGVGAGFLIGFLVRRRD